MIVLHPPHTGGLDHRTRAIFDARDWFAIETSDPALAMAEVCLREKSQAARAAWGLQRLEQIGLLIMQPDDWRHDAAVEHMIDSIKTYLPRIAVWEYDDGDLLLLHDDRPLSESLPPPELHAAPALPLRKPASPRPTEFHLAGAAVAAAAAPVSVDAAESRRLTRQEIDMLLDPLFTMPESEAS